jgi:SAM-dependent methyltransferase
MGELEELSSETQVALTINEFNSRALRLPDENSVLDASQSAAAKHSNIYRDYISKRVVEQYLRPGPSETVLDFGCGVGRLTKFLSSRVRHIEGVDRAEEMIKVGGLRASPNVVLRHISSHLLPYPTRFFDKAFTYWVFQHINNVELVDVLKEINRVLKFGGRLVCFEQTRKQARWFGQLHLQRTTEEYMRLLSESNFTKVKIKPVIRYPSYSMSLWNRFRSTPRLLLPVLGIIEGMTARRRQEFEEYSTTVFIVEKSNVC